MKKVLIMMSGVIESVPEAVNLLREQGFELIFNHTGDTYSDFAPFQDILPEIDALVLGGGRLDEPFFRTASNLKFIVSLGSGVDHIPLEQARQHGVSVANTRGANANAVAELAIGLLISMKRQLIRLNADTKQALWAPALDNAGFEIKGKRIGLLGFGSVAQAFASKLLAFDAAVSAYDSFPNELAARQLQVAFTSIDAIIEQSDVISLHLPGLEGKEALLKAEHFARMKDGVYIINTARASLIDTAVLARALRSGKVKAAAIDVYDQEPVDPANPLLGLDNVIATPHIGASTYETIHRDCMLCAQAIVDYFAGKKPQTLVN